MLSLFTTVCLLSMVANGARILAVWPLPSISHQVVFRPLIAELARIGHDVTVITPDPAFEKGKAPPNIREIDLHDLSYEVWRAKFFETSTGKKDDLATQMKVAVDLLLDIFLKQIQTDEVQQIIQNETFDLVMIEACVRPALLFSHIYKVPVIRVSSFGGVFDNYERMGAPMHPLVYPLSTRQRIYNLTLTEKVTELYNYYVMDREYQNQEAVENNELRKLYSDMPSLSELNNNVQLLLLNMHPLWDGNRPVPPSVVYIGGIYQKPKKELPKDLKLYLDSSKNGVIYVSFGTNVSPSMLPPEKIQTLLKVFSQLPYDVMWKWDKDELPGRTKNIKIFKWLPQSDLLRHPKIKLFITQCGLQSTDEAIAAGVPLLGLPMLGDQWFNAEKYVHLNIGVKVEMDTLNEVDLKKGIYEILNNGHSYRDNVITLGSLMHDQAQPALERAVYWTEHILRHGTGGHLRSPSANMTWSEYFELDLILAAVAVLATAAIVIGVFIVYVRNTLFSASKIKQS